MPGLADSLQIDGSIGTLDAAGVWRLADAQRLDEHGRLGAAAYMYGYVAEIRITAACYRLLRYGQADTIGRSERSAIEKEARRLNLMSSDPHDLAGWMRYLVYLRQREMNGYKRTFRDELVARVEDLYANWRPRLRYRALAPTGAQLNLIRDATNWVHENYNMLWS